MAATNVRVVGSGYTALEYNGQEIAYLQSFQDSGQAPYQSGADAIIPLGARHPVEIATGRVLNSGTITATIYELWNQPVWYQLQDLAGQESIVDVWEALAQSPNPVTCRMVINPPGPNSVPRGKIYHGCVVTGIPDGERVEIGTLSVTKSITIAYTHSTGLSGRNE